MGWFGNSKSSKVQDDNEEAIKKFRKYWDDSLEKAKTYIDSHDLDKIEEAIKILKHHTYGMDEKTISDIKKYRIKAKEIINKEENRLREIKAKELENLLRFDEAIQLWEDMNNHEEAKRIRQIIIDQKKVDQTVVQGDQITKTEIKDSVLNRSNVGGGSSKMQELRELTEMKKEGLIDDDEFKQMKKEILDK